MKTGGRGKAGGVKLAHSPDEAAARAEEILGMDIKGHTVHRVMVAAGRHRSPRSTTSRSCSTAPTAPTWRWPRVEGGVEIEQLAVERPGRAGPGRRSTRRVGIDAAKAAEIVATAGFAADAAPKVAEVLQQLWTVSPRGGRDPRRGQPAGQDRRRPVIALDGKVTLDDNAGFRHPDHAALEDNGVRRPARGQGQGAGPQLRQARRLGRHHRQRRRPGDEHAGRRRATPASSTAGSSPRTSWTSAAAPRPR